MKTLTALSFIIYSAILLLVMMPLAASAHVQLISSEPADESTWTEPVEHIILEYNESIERIGTMQVVNQDGQDYSPDSIEISGSTMTGHFEKPLPNGAYTVNWSAIGTDGHVVRRSIQFVIDVPTPEQAPTDQASDDTVREDSPEPEVDTGEAPIADTRGDGTQQEGTREAELDENETSQERSEEQLSDAVVDEAQDEEERSALFIGISIVLILLIFLIIYLLTIGRRRQ
jgi:methionine-rich copper-binding protein CopC